MTDQFNDDKPALANSIADDIPDIEENFGWLQQVMKMLIGWKTSTIATVSPPGPQRSKFVSTSDTVITIGPGIYFHDGTTRQTVFWDTDIAVTVGSGGTNAASEDLGASEWHYLYLDDSAIVTLGSNELDDTCFVNNTTAPTWSDAKHGWYNGSDRCIFAFYSDGDSDILEFNHDGGDLVGYATGIEDRSTTDLDTTWTDVTLTIPGFSTKGHTRFNTQASETVAAYYRTNGQTDTTGTLLHIAIASNYGSTITPVFTDASQIIEVKHNANGDSTCGVLSLGYYFPTGM